MADNSIGNTAEQAGNQAAAATPKVSALNDQLKQVTDYLTTQLNQGPTNIIAVVDQLGTSTDIASTNFQTFGKTVTETLSSIKAVIGKGIDVDLISDQIGKVVASLSELKMFTKNIDLFEGVADKASSQFATISDSIKATGSDYELLGKLIPNMAQAAIKNLADTASSGQKLQGQFLDMAVAGGNFGDVLDSTGKIVQNIDNVTLEFANTLSTAGDATGFTTGQVAKFAESVKDIPNSMTGVVNTTDAAGTQMTALVSRLTLASGTMIDQSEVAKLLHVAYDNLSEAIGGATNSEERYQQMIADISQVSQTLNIPLKDAANLLTHIAEQFKFVGNESDGATRVIARFTDALRATGLSTTASLDIIKDMTDAVGKLSMGTKAFISLRSGGPGGLQGAFQIEQLLRQGRIDQVVGMVERNLRQQFGGRIYTQAEAAQSPAAAAQFMRQRELIQGGAFGALARTPEQATRLLEALGKGDLGGAAKTIKTGQDALNAATERGNDWQRRNNTQLTRISNASERAAAAAEISALAAARQFIGTVGGSPANRELAEHMGRAAGATLEDQRTRAGTAAGAGENLTIALNRQGSRLTENFIRGIGGMAAGSKAVISDAQERIQTIGNALSGLNQQIQAVTPNQTGAAQAAAHAVGTTQRNRRPVVAPAAVPGAHAEHAQMHAGMGDKQVKITVEVNATPQLKEFLDIKTSDSTTSHNINASGPVGSTHRQ